MTIAAAIARAWNDPDYRAKLLNDPHAALAEVGVEIPAGATINVVEDSADTRHVVLPAATVVSGGPDPGGRAPPRVASNQP